MHKKLLNTGKNIQKNHLANPKENFRIRREEKQQEAKACDTSKSAQGNCYKAGLVQSVWYYMPWPIWASKTRGG